MKLINKELNAEYSSPTLKETEGKFYDYTPLLFKFWKADGWKETKEPGEEEKLDILRKVLSEWESRDVVDMIINEYKNMIGCQLPTG